MVPNISEAASDSVVLSSQLKADNIHDALDLTNLRPRNVCSGETRQLHVLCKSCKSVFSRSKLINQDSSVTFSGDSRLGKRDQIEEERFDLHSSTSDLHKSIHSGCHFCTHLTEQLRSDEAPVDLQGLGLCIRWRRNETRGDLGIAPFYTHESEIVEAEELACSSFEGMGE